MLWILLFCCVFSNGSPHFVYNSKPVVPYEIAGIFENVNSTLMLAFSDSMSHSSQGEIKIEPVMLLPQRTDSYFVWRELCKNQDMRPVAVFGPQNPITDGAVRDQCALANIPHLQATWQPLYPDPVEDEVEEENDEEEEEEVGEEENEEEKEVAEEEKEEPQFKNISINFFPDSGELCTVFAKLLRFFNWESFSVLYDDDFGLMRIQKILANYTDKYPVAVRRLDPESNNEEILKELKLYSDGRILLDCHFSRIKRYLEQAGKVGLLDSYEHFIFTSLDMTLVQDDLLQLPSNSTWLSFTQYDALDLAARVPKWDASDQNRQKVDQFEIEALIMDDIANHVMHAMKAVEEENNSNWSDNGPPSAVCKDVTPWEYGAKLQDKLLTTSTNGVTGNIEFDEMGRRRNYVLYVNDINSGKKNIIGTWESANGSAIIPTTSTSTLTPSQSTGKTFMILIKLGKPFFAYKEVYEEEEDRSVKYEGFGVDLVEAIFNILRKDGYNYKYKFLDPVQDYGKYEPKKKKWGGMIGDLLSKKADMAVCDFTITEERKKVIDFSVPFMSLGISILYVQDREIDPGMFSFLNPYTFDVWLYAATAYCAVSIVLFICARISPADWENPEPCDKDPEELENIWTFKNCAWLTMGSIMTQGCDILPKAFGTRWVCAMWWFFAVIFCQSYIAQLSASMTSALEDEPINSVYDLAKQTKILYGAYNEGSTMEFFRTSKDKTFQQIYERMISNPAVLVGSNDEGVNRVSRGVGRYAYFMESTSIDYKLKRNCKLKKVGMELDSKDYGIGMPVNSPFRSQINRAILSLKESTTLEAIKVKWWNERDNVENCEPTSKKDDVEGDMEMKNLSGLFIVLIVGLFLGVLVTAAEFFNEIRNIVVREQVTHKEALVQELKASLNFFQLQKPILRNPSRAPSIQSSDSSEKKYKSDREKLSAALENFMDFEKQVQ